MPDIHFKNISQFQVLVILGRKFHLVYNVWLSNIPILSSCENSGHNIAFENSSDWLPLQILAFTRSAVIREIGPLHTFQYLFRVLLSWRTFDQTQRYCFAMSIVHEFLWISCHELKIWFQSNLLRFVNQLSDRKQSISYIYKVCPHFPGEIYFCDEIWIINKLFVAMSFSTTNILILITALKLFRNLVSEHRRSPIAPQTVSGCLPVVSSHFWGKRGLMIYQSLKEFRQLNLIEFEPDGGSQWCNTIVVFHTFLGPSHP